MTAVRVSGGGRMPFPVVKMSKASSSSSSAGHSNR